MGHRVGRSRVFFGQREQFGAAGSIVLCIACVGVATLARVATGLIGPTLPFATFFPAVLFSALFGGWLGGLLAIPLSIIAVWYAFVPPAFEFGPLRAVDYANFSLFALSSLVVVWLANIYRRVIRELEMREKERDLLVGEIEHRSKNILAVVTSLIRQTIQDPALAETLVNRVRLAANTDDLLREPGDTQANLASLLVEDVETPNGKDRILLAGPTDIEISGPQARALRIVLHEMTTNALKYGALSIPSGKIRIDWAKDQDTVTLNWREMDGPAVSPPVNFNFGSKLILATLKQINARFEPTFAASGYCYTIVLNTA